MVTASGMIMNCKSFAYPMRQPFPHNLLVSVGEGMADRQHTVGNEGAHACPTVGQHGAIACGSPAVLFAIDDKGRDAGQAGRQFISEERERS
jgi:hypothetical protein